MRIADVVGTIILNRWHPSLTGKKLKLATPLSWENLAGRYEDRLEEIVVLDELGANVGSRIGVSEGREAAMPFYPELIPLDAYNAAILDNLVYDLPE